jgi:LPXTG-motif cell wall-anchored protein
MRRSDDHRTGHDQHTTSTTMPDTASTTVAVSVEPPTTPAPTAAPTTAPDVDVVVAPPAAVTPTAPSVPGTLPVTGGNTNGAAIAGLGLLAAGGLGVLVARRQRRHA